MTIKNVHSYITDGKQKHDDDLAILHFELGW